MRKERFWKWTAALLLTACFGLAAGCAPSAETAAGTGQTAAEEQSRTEAESAAGEESAAAGEESSSAVESAVRAESVSDGESAVRAESGTAGENGEEPAQVTVVLDPGHDSQYCTRNHPDLGLNEQDLNLAIGLACRDRLLQYEGVRVVMTREDGSCPDAEHQGEDCIRARTDVTAREKADIFVSLHNNGTTGRLGDSPEGAQVYISRYSKFTDSSRVLAEKILANLQKIGLASGGVQTRSKAEKGTYDDGTVKDWYYLLSNNVDAGYPAVIIEHAYMDNSYDNTFLKDPQNLKAMGQADADAIASYFGLTFKQS